MIVQKLKATHYARLLREYEEDAAFEQIIKIIILSSLLFFGTDSR